MSNLVYGFGINDEEQPVSKAINGKQVYCPFYKAWTSMLDRCYSKKYQSRKPTYVGCSVCEEWRLFSNFKKWMSGQNWLGMQLDKDVLHIGNKVYSPETCVFISGQANTFVIDYSNNRGIYPVGVSLYKRTGMFMALCRNPFAGKKEYLGYFDTPEKAHEAWRKRKHELACQLADLQDDARVAEALRNRYKTEVQRQLTE